MHNVKGFQNIFEMCLDSSCKNNVELDAKLLFMKPLCRHDKGGNESSSIFTHPISFHVNLYTPDIDNIWISCGQ